MLHNIFDLAQMELSRGYFIQFSWYCGLEDKTSSLVYWVVKNAG